jgi:hypothetical protein
MVDSILVCQGTTTKFHDNVHHLRIHESRTVRGEQGSRSRGALYLPDYRLLLRTLFSLVPDRVMLMPSR